MLGRLFCPVWVKRSPAELGSCVVSGVICLCHDCLDFDVECATCRVEMSCASWSWWMRLLLDELMLAQDCADVEL